MASSKARRKDSHASEDRPSIDEDDICEHLCIKMRKRISACTKATDVTSKYLPHQVDIYLGRGLQTQPAEEASCPKMSPPTRDALPSSPIVLDSPPPPESLQNPIICLWARTTSYDWRAIVKMLCAFQVGLLFILFDWFHLWLKVDRRFLIFLPTAILLTEPSRPVGVMFLSTLLFLVIVVTTSTLVYVLLTVVHPVSIPLSTIGFGIVLAGLAWLKAKKPQRLMPACNAGFTLLIVNFAVGHYRILAGTFSSSQIIAYLKVYTIAALISLTCSFFIFPTWAVDKLKLALAESINDLSGLLRLEYEIFEGGIHASSYGYLGSTGMDSPRWQSEKMVELKRLYAKGLDNMSSIGNILGDARLELFRDKLRLEDIEELVRQLWNISRCLSNIAIVCETLLKRDASQPHATQELFKVDRLAMAMRQHYEQCLCDLEELTLLLTNARDNNNAGEDVPLLYLDRQKISPAKTAGNAIDCACQDPAIAEFMNNMAILVESTAKLSTWSRSLNQQKHLHIPYLNCFKVSKILNSVRMPPITKAWSAELKYACRLSVTVTFFSLFALLPFTLATFKEWRGYWLLISIAVVMTPTVGGSASTGKWRILGTMFGGIWACVTWIIFPGVDHRLGIIFSSTLFATACLFIRYHTSYVRLGRVTLTAFILIINRKIIEQRTIDDSFSSYTLFWQAIHKKHSIFLLALQRSTMIIGGVVVAVMMTGLLMPVFATIELRRQLAEYFDRLASMFSNYSGDNAFLCHEGDVERLEKALGQCTDLLSLAKSEFGPHDHVGRGKLLIFEEILGCARQILNLIAMSGLNANPELTTKISEDLCLAALMLRNRSTFLTISDPKSTAEATEKLGSGYVLVLWTLQRTHNLINSLFAEETSNPDINPPTHAT